jgi:hypothetical protein
MKALCRTRVGGVEISAIGLRPACLPALVRRWAVRRGGGHELRPLHPVSTWTAPRPQRWRLPHGMMNQTNANRQDELFTTETTGLPEVASPGVIRLDDGDRLDLRIGPVRKSLGGAQLRLLRPPNETTQVPGASPRQPRRVFLQINVAEDARFELARGCPQHAFQQCTPAFTGVRQRPWPARTRSGRPPVNGGGRG